MRRISRLFISVGLCGLLAANRQVFAEACGERRQHLHGVADDAVVGEVEDRRVGSVLMATITSALSMPTRCWIAPEMPAAM
jgi:glucuronate isomerase